MWCQSKYKPSLMFLLWKGEVCFRCGRGSPRLSERSLDSVLKCPQQETTGEGKKKKNELEFVLERLQERDSLPSAALQLYYWSLLLLRVLSGRRQAPTCARVLKPAVQLRGGKIGFYKV